MRLAQAKKEDIVYKIVRLLSRESALPVLFPNGKVPPVKISLLRSGLHRAGAAAARPVIAARKQGRNAALAPASGGA